MLSLFHPTLLPWLLAISIPVVIHFLTRRTRRRVDLPTVRFLKRSLARQSKLFKLRHLVILLLRMFAILALVLAFTRPGLVSLLAPPGTVRAGVVIVIDASASMSYSAGGVTSFNRARNEALRVVDGLQRGDEANLILCGAQPKAALSEPGDDRTALERVVRSAQVTEERAQPTAAINLAVQQLAKTKGKEKRLYIFSDFQRSNWADVKFDAVPADTKIVFVSTGADRPQNAGITAMRLYPPNPHVGEPVSVEVEVFNSGASSRPVPVTLALSNGTTSAQSVNLQPYASGTASFALQFDTADQIACTASIPGDSMPLDDTRRAVIDLRRMPTIVLLTDDDTDHAPGAAFFVARALHPDSAGQSGFQVVPVKPGALNNPILHSAAAVVVCDAPSMPAIQYKALSKYVTDGGNLLWFLTGDQIGGQMAALGRELPPAEPIPFQIDHVQDLTGNGKGYVNLSEARYESPLLKAFRDPGAADLTHIQFRKICSTSEVDARAETLLKYEDGTAAAVRTGEGSGNLLLLNMSPAPSWSDLARQEAFLPLLHEFLKGIVTRDTGAREFVAGAPASVTVVPPGGHVGRITCSGPDGDTPVISDPVTGSVVIDHTQRTGLYALADDGKPVATVAVNLHPDETDLRAIDPRELETDFRRANSYFAGAGVHDPGIAELDRGRPLWPYLILLTIICLCAEQWVSRLAPRPLR